MALTTGILPEDVRSSPVRIPLQIRTTSPSPASTLKQVRRKDSFMRRADSSEDYPSPHESIFEAFYFSASNSDESNSRIELITLYPHGQPNDENRGPSTPVHNLDDIQFRYGHGTILETITEQKSTGGTARTICRTKSLDNMPNFPFLNHRDSFVLAKTPRRRQSFSLDDLALINRYYHDACAVIEKGTYKPPPLVVTEIYAQPKKPLHAPPDRPSTPPGMPSWTAAQNIPPRGRLSYTPLRQTRFQRLFGLPATEIAVSSRVPQPVGLVTDRNRVVSAPIRGRAAPRFRPPRSAYGPLDQHPFSRAPIAQVVSGTPSAIASQAETISLSHRNAEPGIAEIRRQKSRRRRLMGHRVRFTPSATARDSEALALQSAIESTSANALHPLTPMQAFLQSETAPIPGECHHRRDRLSKTRSQSRGNSTSKNITTTKLKYAILPSHSPTRTEQVQSMGPGQLAFPAMSRITVASNPPYSEGALPLEDAGIAPTPTSTREADSRVSSANSTAPLVPGALRQSLRSASNLRRQPPAFVEVKSTVKNNWCWKCKFDEGFKMVDRWWINSMSFVCFICCGFDVDEDESIVYPERAASFNPYDAGLRGNDRTTRPHSQEPRRLSLDHSSRRLR